MIHDVDRKGSEMEVREVREIGKQWIHEHRAEMPGYCGAIFQGSSLVMPGKAEWPSGSDLDIKIFQINPVAPLFSNKLLSNGIVLDVSCCNFETLSSTRKVLAAPLLAPQFAKGTPVDDPYGLIAPVYREVKDHYREKKWVRARLRSMYQKARWSHDFIINADKNATVFNRILRYIGSAHCTANLIAIASFQNITLCRCFAALEGQLSKCRAADLHEDLLGIYGWQDMSADAVRGHLRAMHPLSERAIERKKTPYWGHWELFPENRDRLFAAAEQLIDEGHHREAIHFLFLMHNFFMSAIRNDGTKRDQSRYWPLFEHLAEEAGIPDYDACRERTRRSLSLLGKLHAKAKELTS